MEEGEDSLCFEHVEYGKSVKILVEMSDGMVEYRGLELKREI